MCERRVRSTSISGWTSHERSILKDDLVAASRQVKLPVAVHARWYRSDDGVRRIEGAYAKHPRIIGLDDFGLTCAALSRVGLTRQSGSPGRAAGLNVISFSGWKSPGSCIRST